VHRVQLSIVNYANMCGVCCVDCYREFYLHSHCSVQCFSLYTSFVGNTLQCTAVYFIHVFVLFFSIDIKFGSRMSKYNYSNLILQNMYHTWILTNVKQFSAIVEVNHNCADMHVRITGRAAVSETTVMQGSVFFDMFQQQSLRLGYIIQVMHSCKWNIQMCCPEVDTSSRGRSSSDDISTKGQFECCMSSSSSSSRVYSTLWS